MSAEEGEYVELYGEYVSLKDLGIGSLSSAFFAFLFYGGIMNVLEAIGMQGLDPRLKVVFGVIGAAFGFIIASLIIKPKRVLEEE